MTYDGFLEEVCWRTGLDSREVAARVVAATLETVGERLSRSGADLLRQDLMPPLADLLGRARSHQAFAPDRLFERVGQEESVRPGIAVEHAKVVCEVLTESLDAEGRLRLCRELPPEWASLFVPRSRESGEPAAGSGGRGHRLADGRPGSRHPASEAAPPPGQSESVVLAENPHAGEKLSSAPGPRLGTPIAVGAPGSETPLSEGPPPLDRSKRS